MDAAIDGARQIELPALETVARMIEAAGDAVMIESANELIVERDRRLGYEPDSAGPTLDTDEVHRRVMARLRKMTEAEGRQSLIHAGLIDEDGNLAEHLTKGPTLSYREPLGDDAQVEGKPSSCATFAPGARSSRIGR